jgi:hypothetical protein
MQMCLAGIQYMRGSSLEEVQIEIICLVKFGDRIIKAGIITSANNHGFLLSINHLLVPRSFLIMEVI